MKTKRSPRGLYAPEPLEPRIAPATIIVTTLADAGAGSLRQAILDANDPAMHPGADTIIFKGAAAAGGEISMAAGEMAITDSLTIRGPGAGKLIIDAGNLSRIFNITDGTGIVKSVSISGLSMVDGNAVAANGGGIFCEESLSLSNVVVSGCTATGAGGGVLVKTTTPGSGKVSVKASIISGNTATEGGGMYLRSGAILVSGSTISGNTALSNSGGLYAYVHEAGTGDIVIENCKIIGNSAAAQGGGAGLENDREVGGVQAGKIIVRNSIISGNRSTGNSLNSHGGGLYLDHGFVLIDRCQISNNSATHGSGIFDQGSDSLTIKNSTITGNHATDAAKAGGGGLFVLGDSKVVIQSSVISGNTSASDGGGIVAENSTVLLKGSTVSGNTAADDGGGAHAFNGSVLTVESSFFLDNSAGSSGGGLHTQGAGADAVKLTIKGSLFRANHAGFSGGGVDTEDDGAVSISGSKFIGNATVGDAGGAMYLRSSAAIVITSSTIVQNAGGIGAGGVALSGSGPKSIVGTLIRDNIAITGDGGGIGLFSTGILTLSKTTSVMYNAAPGQGGGIVNGTADATKLVLNGAKILANTAPTDPQISGPSTP